MFDSLRNISFTNNRGTVTLSHGLIGEQAELTWDGRQARRTRRVSVSGHLLRGEGTGADLASMFPGDGVRGEPGTLTLPWAQFAHAVPTGVTLPVNEWIDGVPLSIEFLVDENGPAATSTTVLGWTLHAPRFAFAPAADAWGEEVQPLRPDRSLGGAGGDTFGLGNRRHLRRSRGIHFAVSGQLRLADGLLPENWRDTLCPRIGRTHPARGGLPEGHPVPLAMSEICPALEDRLPLRHLTLEQANLSWDVTNAIAGLTVAFLGPPQAT